MRQQVEPLTTTSDGRHQRGGCCGALGCLYSCSSELRTKEAKKNKETKIGSIGFHDRTMCNVLEDGRGVFGMEEQKYPEIPGIGSPPVRVREIEWQSNHGRKLWRLSEWHMG